MKQVALDHFKENDAKLFELWQKAQNFVARPEPVAPESYFFKLARHITYQQLSGKAGDAIFGKLALLFSDGRPTPELVLAQPHAALRGAGLSNAKVHYLKNIAEAIVNGQLKFDAFSTMEDEAIIETLTQIKGIGRWTAEMFLMFTLGRENVFSHGDLGLLRALQRWYEVGEKPVKAQVEQLTAKWSPYKTYASLILWGSLEIKNEE